MADYRKFQPRRGSDTANWRIIGAVLIVVGGLTALGVWAFGGDDNKNSAAGGPEIRLINDAGNANTSSTDGGQATNANANANTNTSVDEGVVVPAISSTEALAIATECSSAVSSASDGRGAALTFDIAGDNEAVTKLLEVLQAKKTPASFFITGGYATDHGDLVKRLIGAGYPVYSRGTATSKQYGTMTAAEVATDLQAAEEAISAVSGQSTKPFFRPARGETSAAQVKAAQSAGFCTILWTVDGSDWDDSQTVDGAVARVMEKAKDGSIILLHAGYDITPDVVSQVVTQLSAKDIRPVPLVDLVGAGD